MGVLYTQALADRAQAWLSRPLTNTPEGKRSAEGLLELATLWAAINQQPLPECLRQCQYSERARSVAAYLLEFSRLPISPSIMSDTPQSKYQIAPAFAGQQFVHEDLSAPTTAENLTDELAEFWLKKGRDDAFIKRSSADATESAGTTEVVSEKPLVPQADLEAEQEAHEATQQALASEEEAHAASKAKAADALKAEKEAHKATKKDLSEVSKQLADTQKQLADAQKQLADLAEKAGNTAGDAATDVNATDAK